MKFNNYCVSLMLVLVHFAIDVKQTEAQTEKDIFIGALPVISALVGSTVTGPIGPVIVASLGVLELSTKILLEEETLSKRDFLESQSKIANAVQNVGSNVLEATAKLAHIVESNEFLEKMRIDLEILQQSYANNIGVILNRGISGTPKNSSDYEMLNYFSGYRKLLKSFITKYITPKEVIPSHQKVDLFYDFILKKDQIAADYGENCDSDSTHTKIFKSYLYILKTLTDAYVMAIAAHTIQYQKDLEANSTNNAIEIRRLAFVLLNEYKLDMKLFMEKTNWALNNASRDIRKCGKFDLKRGETFEQISFAHILPKFRSWHPDEKKHIPDPWARYSECFPDNKYNFVKINDYELGECTDGGFFGTMFVYGKPMLTKNDWPFTFIEISYALRANVIIGNKNTNPEPKLLTEDPFLSLYYCSTLFCPAFTKNAVAISTQRVRAKRGNVITGLRFRVRENVIYIDIQQGKFLDDMRVDPKTVTWTETPKSNELLFMNMNARSIELGGIELEYNAYLTAIQLVLKDESKGIIGFTVIAESPPGWKTHYSNGIFEYFESNELVLPECDNPERFGSDVKNMISKAPEESEPYHVSFQPTNLKKDLGITTIPFIDIREVVSDPPAPLGGCGIYYQTVKGSGGFLSLKLITPNWSRFVNYNFIEQAVNITDKVESSN